MNKSKTNTDSTKSNLLSYTVGFILSLAITMVAFVLIFEDIVSGWAAVYSISALAIIQLLVQVHFFLHISDGKKPRLNLLTFCFMTIIVLILVVGSIWIMKNLDYNMMPQSQEQYMLDQYDKGGF